MSLTARRSAQQRDKFVMRLGCVLVSVALLASLVLEPPRAKAEALTLAVGGGIVLLAGYLTACGMTPYFTGDWNGESVARELQKMGEEFVEETKVLIFPGGDKPSGGDDKPSFHDWMGAVAFTVSNGIVRFGKDAAAMLNKFVQWVAAKYGTKPGQNVVYSETSSYVTLADGSKFYLCTDYVNGKFLNAGSAIIAPSSYPIIFSTGCSVVFGSDNYISFLDSSGGVIASFDSTRYGSGWSMYVGLLGSSVYFLNSSLSTFSIFAAFRLSLFDIGAVVDISESLALDVSDQMQAVLDRLTALEEGQAVALDVGATQSMEIQEILQDILDKILAGDLTASVEAVDEEVVDPPAETLPDVDDLGLPALGAALTSRFPFSIPWDVYKGVTLLAAPPKAPYFEVDFMAPIADRVGGWKGSTKIVLDFAEYEIIGQVCRWTSTIGFCLMLATGTKRLIWTA